MANQFEYGEVLLAEYPFTDHTSAKLRPVLVISQKEFNRGDDLVVLPISSRMVQDDPYGFAIPDTSPYFQAAGLRWASSVKWTKPMTISAAVIERRLGKLPDDIMAQIIDKMLGMFHHTPLLRK
jgi:mRNA-degrading endonuclease toxin of MazEF toxin-antitoxin module